MPSLFVQLAWNDLKCVGFIFCEGNGQRLLPDWIFQSMLGYSTRRTDVHPNPNPYAAVLLAFETWSELNLVPRSLWTYCWIELTFMVTVIVLFTFALCSQPCFITPPFWEHRDEESWKRAKDQKERRSGELPPMQNSPWTQGICLPWEGILF